MFKLLSTPLELDPLCCPPAAPEAGAFVAFEGRVRATHDGKSVIALEYEADPDFAQAEAGRILQEALTDYPLLEAHCLHRIGRLKVNDLAVWVGVTAAHRDEAFKACRRIIDELKKRLPIWKKEYYTGGASAWLDGRTGPCGGEPPQQEAVRLHPGPSFTEEDYYRRQTPLAALGFKGQQKLKQSRVLVVGAGGLGCPALLSLAQSGIGTIGICDPDTVTADNLHRQGLYTTDDIGQDKAAAAARRLQKVNPFINLLIHNLRLEADHITGLLPHYDIIIDASDNFETKFLLNDAAFLMNKPLIQGAVFQWEGRLSVLRPDEGGGCLRCLWPEPPAEGCAETCGEAGILGAVPALLGHAQALEAVKYILGLPVLPSGTTLLFDLQTWQTTPIALTPREDCPLCGPRATIHTVSSPTRSPDTMHEHLDIHINDIPTLRDYIFIDVREAHERQTYPVQGLDSIHLPLSTFPWNYTFAPEKKYLVFCEAGIRSRYIVEQLRAHGINNLTSILAGRPALEQRLAREGQ